MNFATEDNVLIRDIVNIFYDICKTMQTKTNILHITTKMRKQGPLEMENHM